MKSGRMKVLVADSGAFIKGVPLENWSSKVVTVKEVVEEIRDEATRRRLQVLPYELNFTTPTFSALQHGNYLWQICCESREGQTFLCFCEIFYKCIAGFIVGIFLLLAKKKCLSFPNYE